MRKLNYRPNELARSLQNKSSNTIGVIVPHIRHPYFAEMISNLENEAHKKGYKMLLCNSQGRDEKMLEYVEMCYSNRVAGLVLFSGTVDASAFEKLDIPIITVERYVDTATASVECDNIQGERWQPKADFVGMPASAAYWKFYRYTYVGGQQGGWFPSDVCGIWDSVSRDHDGSGTV